MRARRVIITDSGLIEGPGKGRKIIDRGHRLARCGHATDVFMFMGFMFMGNGRPGLYTKDASRHTVAWIWLVTTVCRVDLSFLFLAQGMGRERVSVI
ncbi:hypothetical protein F4859DRAFT_172895 [Xylaria cf. heliscus]|nr:hypothetical protein F4859DRAFT_172895 [Xylaria cf. heliscus]